MRPSRRLGLLGGTFDPVHLGHLDAAGAARAALALDEVWFIPSHAPPHRSAHPLASDLHRYALVALAVDGHEACRACDLELGREGPSYTQDTLRTLQAQGWEPSQLFFILGADAIAEIATWHGFPAVLDLAPFVVIARPGVTLDEAVARTPALGPRVHDGRTGAPEGPATRVILVEAATRDVSSTLIRARRTARQAIDDLVPAPVARYIETQGLYDAVGGLHGSTTAG
jgi:nicotinate-nucleotide adenylyltransferase